jgi:hypothetical protein
MDCDGFQKAKVTSYGDSDSEIEAITSNNADADQVQQESDEQGPDQKLKKDMDTHKKILREKHSKYL